jgi:hypothetical protein
MIEALTAPAYVEALRAVRAAPEEMRLVEASRRLSPDALRDLGVPIPPGMRITSRYFERGFPTVELGDPPGGGVNTVNALNELQPGLLDRLRKENLALFRNLATPEGEAGPEFSPDVDEELRLGGCSCGGAPVSIFGPRVCGGAGVYL